MYKFFSVLRGDFFPVVHAAAEWNAEENTPYSFPSLSIYFLVAVLHFGLENRKKNRNARA